MSELYKYTLCTQSICRGRIFKPRVRARARAGIEYIPFEFHFTLLRQLGEQNRTRGVIVLFRLTLHLLMCSISPFTTTNLAVFFYVRFSFRVTAFLITVCSILCFFLSSFYFFDKKTQRRTRIQHTGFFFSIL